MAQTGTVKFFKETEGWGFITADADGKDYFVHATKLEGNIQIKEGDAVIFEAQTTQKGHDAVNVKLK